MASASAAAAAHSIGSRFEKLDPEDVFVLTEKIGKGAFGEVWRGQDRRNKAFYAIKVIDLEAAQDEIEEIQQEAWMLSQCLSPYVTGYRGSYLKGMKLWMVMELLCGSAFDMMKPKGVGTFDEASIAVIAHEVLQGLVYLHSEGKIHRDLKAANVLISNSGEIKLADFGVSGQLSIFKKKVHAMVGTPHWMAPEIAKKEAYDEKADIWSFGVTLIELAKGDPPNPDTPANRALYLIANNPPPQLPGANYSKTFKEFLALCLVKDPAQRPSAAELLKHKFVKSAKRKPGFLADRIEKFQKWRLKGGGDDSDSDNDSDDDELRKLAPDLDQLWDFSPGSPPPSMRSNNASANQDKPVDQAALAEVLAKISSKSNATNEGDAWADGLKVPSSKQRRQRIKPKRGRQFD